MKTYTFLKGKQDNKWCFLKKFDFSNMTNKVGQREYYIKSEFLGHMVDGRVLRVWKKLCVLPFSMWMTATVFLKFKI